MGQMLGPDFDSAAPKTDPKRGLRRRTPELAGELVPQRLKPKVFCEGDGTAEAVPLQNEGGAVLQNEGAAVGKSEGASAGQNKGASASSNGAGPAGQNESASAGQNGAVARKAERVGKNGRRILPDDAVSAATRKMRMLRSLACGNKYEKLARATGATLIAGVDEVGRGCLFGPVVAAAVILPLDTRIRGLRDSKQLLQEDRERLELVVRQKAIAVAVEEVDAETIDRVNIYQASRMAMAAAVMKLDPQPEHLLIDALRLDLPHAQTKIIYGDSLSISIAAASVVAKVYRDRRMCELDAEYPGYGLKAHKGYATPEHRAALEALGPSALHRRSFTPVLQGELPWEDFVAEEGPEEQGIGDRV